MPEKMLKGFHFFKATDTPNETHLLPHSQSQGYPRYQKTFFFQATGCIIPSPYKGWDNRNSPNTKVGRLVYSTLSNCLNVTFFDLQCSATGT